MSFVELLGFLISFGAVIFFVSRRIWEVFQSKDPILKQAEELKQKKVLQNFLSSLDIQLEDEKPHPKKMGSKKSMPKQQPKPLEPKKHKPLVESASSYQASIDQYKQDVSLSLGGRTLQRGIDEAEKKLAEQPRGSARDFHSRVVSQGVSRGEHAMAKLSNRKHMFIFQTLLNPPKGLQ